MPGCVSSGLESALHRSIAEHTGICHKSIYRVNAGIQVVLYLIEVAIVVIGNLRRYVTLTDALHIFGCHIERSDYGIECIVYTLHYSSEISLVLRRVCSRIQSAIHSGLCEEIGICHKSIYRVNTSIQICSLSR